MVFGEVPGFFIEDFLECLLLVPYLVDASICRGGFKI